jgi:hypothetical protein
MGNCCSCDIESYGIESYGYNKDLHTRVAKYKSIQNKYSFIKKDRNEIDNQPRL